MVKLYLFPGVVFLMLLSNGGWNFTGKSPCTNFVYIRTIKEQNYYSLYFERDELVYKFWSSDTCVDGGTNFVVGKEYCLEHVDLIHDSMQDFFGKDVTVGGLDLIECIDLGDSLLFCREEGVYTLCSSVNIIGGKYFPYR